MKVVIIGATGATGKELLKLLLNDKCITEVVALIRNPTTINHQKLKSIVVNFDHLEEWKYLIQADVAISCLGTTLKIAGSKKEQYKVDYTYQYHFAQIAKENRIPTFVLISSTSASKNSFFFYSKMKGELDEAILKMNFNNTIIFKPGPLIRPNSDRNGEKLGVKLLRFLNTIGIAKNLTPIEVENLAKIMLNNIKNIKSGPYILESKDIVNQITK